MLNFGPTVLTAALLAATAAQAQDGTWLQCDVVAPSGTPQTRHFMFSQDRFYDYNATQDRLRDLCTTQLNPGTGEFADENHEIVCTVSAATLEQRTRWLGVSRFRTQVVIDRSNGRIVIHPGSLSAEFNGRCRTIDDPRPPSQGF